MEDSEGVSDGGDAPPPPADAPRPPAYDVDGMQDKLDDIAWPEGAAWLEGRALTAANVAEAVRLTGARQVDVSSGVERARGVKDHAMIADFVAAAG